MNNTTYFDSSVAVLQSSLWIKVSFIIYLLVIHVIGVPGNIIVAVVYSRTSPKSACDWLIFIMGVTDCIVCFCTPLFYLRAELDINLPWKYNAMCCFQNGLQFSAMIASCLILVVIAVDRYIKICCHCVFSLTPSRARNLGVLCVLTSIAVCVFPFVRQGQTTGCFIHAVKPPESVRRYALIMFCGFIVCFVIVIFAYANICKQIRDKTALRRRLKKDNGLRSPVKDIYPRTKIDNDCWWRPSCLKQRDKAIHIFHDLKETDENECDIYLNSQPVDDFSSDNVKECCRLGNGEIPRNCQNLSLLDSKTISSRSERWVNPDTNGVRESELCGIKDKEINYDINPDNIDHGKAERLNGHFEVHQNTHNPHPFMKHTLHIPHIKEFSKGDKKVLEDLAAKPDRLLNLGNDGERQLISNCFVSNEIYEILPNAKRFNNNLSTMSIDTSHAHEKSTTTDRRLVSNNNKPFETVQNDYNLIPRHITREWLCRKVANHKLMSRNDILRSETQSLCNGLVFPKSLEIQGLEFTPPLNYTELSSHEMELKGYNSSYDSCRGNNSMSELSRKIRLHARTSRLKNSVSCPNLMKAECDKTGSYTSYLRTFPIYASLSEIFDELANRTLILLTKYRSDLANRQPDRRKCSKREAILNNNTSLSPFPFPVHRVSSTQQNTESCERGFHGKSENAMTSGNCLKHNGQAPAVREVLDDVCLDEYSPESFNGSAVVANAPSVTFSSNKPYINRDFDEAAHNHDFKHLCGIDRKGYCCNDNISQTILACSAGETSGLCNRSELCLLSDDASNANEETVDNINHSQTEIYSPPKDFLTIPFLPRHNPNGQKSDPAPEGSRKTSIKVGKSQIFRVKLSNKDVGDGVSSDFPSDPSSSRCWKQTEESHKQTTTSTKCRLKSLAGGKRCNRERQMTLMLASVAAAFLLSWLPPWLFHILWYYGPIENSQSFVVWYVSKIYLIIYATNPLIYYNFNQSFRSKVRHLLAQVFKCFHCRRN